MDNYYKQCQHAGNGILINKKPIEQASKLELIQTIVYLRKEVQREREAGISLLKSAIRNKN